MFVTGDQGLRAAKEATTTIPIVVIACDPLDSLVASIAPPGGKATGLTCISSELASKRLQFLKELVSRARPRRGPLQSRGSQQGSRVQANSRSGAQPAVDGACLRGALSDRD
jgi:hypothetical protein